MGAGRLLWSSAHRTQQVREAGIARLARSFAKLCSALAAPPRSAKGM